MLPRFILLTAAACSLSSCGTASHYLGKASGLLNSITSPVLGAIRLSDSPDLPGTTSTTTSSSTTSRPPAKLAGPAPDALSPLGSSPAAKLPVHDSRRTPAKRSD